MNHFQAILTFYEHNRKNNVNLGQLQFHLYFRLVARHTN